METLKFNVSKFVNKSKKTTVPLVHCAPPSPTPVLLTSRKHMTGFLVKSLEECIGSTVLMVVCYWPTSHCTPAQTLVSVSGEFRYNRSPLVLDSDNGVCYSAATGLSAKITRFRGAARIFLRGGLKLWKQKPCKGKIACD